jgi:hypothetical protein
MPQILESALDSRVALAGILCRHSHYQAADFGEDTLAPGALFAYIHFRTMSCRCHRTIVSGVTTLAI